MTSLRAAVGAGVGALIAAGLVATAAAALYLGIVNRGELALAQTPTLLFAHALAARAATAAAAENPADVQRTLDELSAARERSEQGRPRIRLATVVSEPRSTKYRFLRKRRFVAHSQAARAGQALDASRADDKEIYDLANRVRQGGVQIDALTAPGRGGSEMRAAVPVVVRGEHAAMAAVVMALEPRPPVSPGWPLAAGLGCCVLVGILLGVVAPRRARYAAVACATLSFAVFAHVHLARTLDGYRDTLQLAGEGLARSLGVDAAAALAQVERLPEGGRGPLIAAAVLGLAVCLAGLGGVGERAGAALRRHRFALAYVAPSAIGMALLVLIPFGYGLGLGFFDHAHGRYTFVGLANFAEILSGGGRPLTHPLNFYFTLGVTVLWTAVNVLLHTAIGLGLALLLRDPLLRFKGVYRVLLILPWAVPNYITALIWKGMFHQQYGAVNHVLGLLGIERVSWFSSFSAAFTANVVTNTWLGFPFMMVVALGALQSIPRDVYEAAAVDGASRWQTFRRITLPLLRPALFPAIILGSIWTFNMFNIIYLVSQGEPAGATDILITEAYRWAFERADRYGLAAAYAAIIFVILLGYTLITNRMARATEDVLE
jgi:ABC-type sugar transport system permease subunit